MYLIAWGGQLVVDCHGDGRRVFLCGFGAGINVGNFTGLGGRRVGSILGFTNMCGNLAAGASVGTSVSLRSQQWPTVFLISAGAFFLVAACWLGVDASKRGAGDT